MHQQFFNENSLVTVPHSPYSPDLAPSNLWLYGHFKTSLLGRLSNDIYELLQGVIEFLKEIQRSELQLVLHHWIKRAK
jgi:hypothetical protein